jgi:DNA polymerase II small subunit/DNA polymerase delta subunit B
LKDRQINGKKNLIKAEQIICPQWGDIAKIFIKDYKITIYDCKNNHTTNNISFNKFEETQKMMNLKLYVINVNIKIKKIHLINNFIFVGSVN